MQTPDDAVLGPRDLVTVGGSDAPTYLQSQLSQDITTLPVGESTWTFVLDPSGKIVALARVRRVGETEFVLDTDAGFGGLLRDRLARFLIRVDVALGLSEADPIVQRSAADERRRIEMGWPQMGTELVPGETMVAGTGLSGIAVSFTKGCYPGQELVERMDSRGAEPPRSLRVIDVDSGTRPGDPILDAEGAEVGVITSVADDRALGWLQRGARPSGAAH